MKTGMLWFDNDPKTSLREKIEKAIAYYMQKYMLVPNLCLVHPTMIEADLQSVGKVQIRAYRSVLPGHMWIGVEE